MQIVIEKESLVSMLKVSLYVLTEADYKNVGDVVNELLEKVGYKEIPTGHGRLIDADVLWDLYHSNDYDFYEALDDAPTIIEADEADEAD